MLEYLALILMTTTETHKTAVSLKPGHCYSSSSEYRPNTIGISGFERSMYKYHIFYGMNAGWSGSLWGKPYTLSYVYNKEITCP